MKKIYIAGPDVFRQNYQFIVKERKLLCDKYGFIGIFPADDIEYDYDKNNNIPLLIKKENQKSISSCDIVIANITPFRGAGADNGTTYEIGYAEALGKQVILYSEHISIYKDRVYIENQKFEDLVPVDKNGFIIEDFNLQDNLMFSCQEVFSSFEEALLSITKK